MSLVNASSNGNDLGDVYIRHRGGRVNVTAGPNLLATGWRGGVFVQYAAGPQDFTVERSEGNITVGFLISPSEQYDTPFAGANYGPEFGSIRNNTSIQPRSGVGAQNVVSMMRGGCSAYFLFYEKNRLVAGQRTGAPIIYQVNDLLKISENGLLTNDADGDLLTVGIANPVRVGRVGAVPQAQNFFRLGADLLGTPRL